MRVRATVNIGGAEPLRVGDVRRVDPRSARVKSMIEKGWFVPIDEPPAKGKRKR